MNDVAIVGGGIVGLSTAYQLLLTNPQLKITVLEKENTVGKHQTGNNSGVIHSGIYYKPGSLKAQNCITGYKMLIDFCDKHQIPYELCGKIIVATKESELTALDTLFQRGIENELDGLKYLDEREIKEIEPNCTGIKGIWVPQTGIVNYRLICEKLKELIGEFPNAQVRVGFRVSNIENLGASIKISHSQASIETKFLVNCAGLYCDKIAELSGEKLNVKIIPFRGEYYSLKPTAKHLVRNLIYPVPDANFPFLGVHFTRRISGEIEAGPNAVFAFKREGYKKTDFDIRDFFESLFWKGFRRVMLKYWKTGLGEYYRSYSKRAFTKALQQLVPSVRESDLEPAGAGVRAQACDKDGGLIDDFYIQKSTNMIHVLNAPSPAATSSLSIGKTVSEMIIASVK